MTDLEIGSIVWGAHFPTYDGATAPHPGLVTRIDTGIGFGPRARVVLGSSKKVSLSGHLETEFVVTPRDPGFSETGLKVATRFAFQAGSFMLTPVMDAFPIGRIRGRTLMVRLEEAYIAYLRQMRH